MTPGTLGAIGVASAVVPAGWSGLAAGGLVLGALAIATIVLALADGGSRS